MIHRTSLLLSAVCLTVLAIASSARAQTFDIEELPVLSEKENQFSIASFINQRGDILGRRTVNDGQFASTHAFLWNGNPAIDFGAPSDFSEGRGLNDLGQIIGRDFGVPGEGFFWDGQSTIPLGFAPNALNNLGQVAGSEFVSTFESRALLWDAENGLRDLGYLLGGTHAQALFINERGHVAGNARDAGFLNHGFFWSEETGMVDLGLHGLVQGMNDHDQIVLRTNSGFSFRSSVTITPQGEAVVLREDLPTVIRPDGTPATGFVSGINNAGQAVGQSGGRIVFWDTNTTLIVNQDTRTTGGVPFVNDSGHVAFRGALNVVGSQHRGFFWDPLDGSANGTTISLPTLEGGFTDVTDINEFDQIVGGSETTDGTRAVIWRPTGPIPEGSVEILLLKELVRTLLGDGSLFEGDAVSLLGKLCAADNQLRGDNAAGAIGVLGSAQNQIDQLIRNNFINAQTGQELISAIELIIQSL